MAEQWSTETEDALAAEFDGWRGIRINKSDLDKLAREALMFLADRRLLVPSGGRWYVPHSGPRVWAMPQIPPDVVKVRAAFDGSIWVRHPSGKGWWVDEDDDPTDNGNPEVDLIADLGPLTEVAE